MLRQFVSRFDSKVIVGGARARHLSIATWRKKLALRKDSGDQFRESSGAAEQLPEFSHRSPISFPTTTANTQDVNASDFRVTNLSAGPSTIDESVLRDAQLNFLNHHGSGMGIMEMSHRDHNGPVQTAMTNATNSIRNLLDVPSNYHILWMPGGAHAQFAATIQNCMGDKNQVDVIQSGFWANRFLNTEAYRRTNVNLAWSGESLGYKTLAPASEWRYSTDSAFIHMCMNETIDGVEFHEDPVLPADAPFVSCDATSTLLSRTVDVSKYGLLYASSGKNLGPAGVTCVIVRDDLLNMASDECPSVLNYTEQAQTSPIPSLFNTPPTYVIYMASKVLEQYEHQGGLQVIEENAKFRSQLIYDIIDESEGFYTNHADPTYRSRMTIPFRVMNGVAPELETKFMDFGAREGIHQLFAHPLFPGLRITMYNQLPMKSVFKVAESLIAFNDDHKVHLHPANTQDSS
eukprot:m.186166 g.186166  ORF g.186166 m.186166 type:complete len:461 (-) comp32257_c2_seq1:95-1477(-)